METLKRHLSAADFGVRALLLMVAVVAVIALASTGPTGPIEASNNNLINSPDTAGVVGRYTSMELDSAGRPVVSYRDETNGDLKILHCGNTTCTSGNSITSPDSAGDVGTFTSLVLDASGYPVVAYRNEANGDLKVMHCNDVNCSGGGESFATPAGTGAGDVLQRGASLVLDGLGNPVIVYNYRIGESERHLRVLHCGNANCTAGNSIQTPDSGGNVTVAGDHTLDASGFPVVPYRDLINFDLKFMHCNDANCAGGDESFTTPDTSNTAESASIELDSAGNPVMSYWNSGVLKVLHCDDPNCAGVETPEAADYAPNTDIGLYSSMELDGFGRPVIAYWDRTFGNLKLLRCDDSSCSAVLKAGPLALDTGGNVGAYASLELDSSGRPVISYSDETNGDLKVLRCATPVCTGDDSVVMADTDTGGAQSIVLDASGNPVISYYDWTNDDLRIMHCSDVNCTGGTTTSPDTTGDVGQETSITLDASGYPVVSYWDADNEDLKVLHCNDPACDGAGDSITTPDSFASTGRYSSLQLDASGYPVISYFYGGTSDLRVMHCNDVNCAGLDESIATPDSVDAVGAATSLELDASGFPVVSYWDQTNGALKLLHCGNVNCTAGNVINSPDAGEGTGGFYATSLEFDSAGNPAIAYYSIASGDLKMMDCNDPNCDGVGDVARTLDSTGDVGQFVSMQISGINPVMSYHDNTNGDLKVLHCGDPGCSAIKIGSPVSPDTDDETGSWTSLAVDGSGNPVVAYRKDTSALLRVLHCNDHRCSPPPAKAPAVLDEDADSCPSADELGLSATTGGLRDPNNPWDYFNPSLDGLNRPDDILLVVNAYFMDDNDGNPGLPPYAAGYNPGTDRTDDPGSGEAWDLLGPNGVQRVDDILHIVNQYFHDCS